MTLVLDAGALIALDRNERPMWVRLKRARTRGEVPLTSAAVLGQVWRDGLRQARLAQALRGIDIVAVDEPAARAAGELLAATGGSDVVDAVLALLARDGDCIVTADVGDLKALASAAGQHVELVRP